MFKYILDRLSEPSSYGGIAAGIGVFSAMGSGAVDVWYGAGAILASVIAVFAPDSFKDGFNKAR
jgi:hypothetical protein